MFSAEDVPAFLWTLLTAALSLIVGVLLLWKPVEGAVSLTLVLHLEEPAATLPTRSVFFVEAGGLMSCGTDQVEIFRQAASYVDRIMRGAKPADLPVQAPAKFETVHQPQNSERAGPDRAAEPARDR